MNKYLSLKWKHLKPILTDQRYVNVMSKYYCLVVNQLSHDYTFSTYFFVFKKSGNSSTALGLYFT